MNAWDADGHGRMGGEDEDGDQGGRATGPVKDNTGKPKKLIWNRFKWVLFCANILVSGVWMPKDFHDPDLYLLSVLGLFDRHHGGHAAGLVRHFRKLGRSSCGK
jgi:hypothetical protein